MDQLLPVPFGGLDGRGVCFAKHWRDVFRSAPYEVTQPTVEPLSRFEAKQHLKTSLSDDDAWIDRAIVTARFQVEMDTNHALPTRALGMTFDQFPIERAIDLPMSPLVSVSSISSFDILTGLETVFDSAKYLVDTASQPGRVGLITGAIWPVGVRTFLGGKVLFTAGYGLTSQSVSTLTRSGATVTVTTSAPHNFTSGLRVTTGGADQDEYNGTFPIVVTGASTYTLTLSKPAVDNAPVSPATGSLSATLMNIPPRYVHAMALLLGHYDYHREAVTSAAARYTPDEYPLGYEALIGDRIVSFG